MLPNLTEEEKDKKTKKKSMKEEMERLGFKYVPFVVNCAARALDLMSRCLQSVWRRVGEAHQARLFPVEEESGGGTNIQEGHRPGLSHV